GSGLGREHEAPGVAPPAGRVAHGLEVDLARRTGIAVVDQAHRAVRPEVRRACDQDPTRLQGRARLLPAGQPGRLDQRAVVDQCRRVPRRTRGDLRSTDVAARVVDLLRGIGVWAEL